MTFRRIDIGDGGSDPPEIRRKIEADDIRRQWTKPASNAGKMDIRAADGIRLEYEEK